MHTQMIAEPRTKNIFYYIFSHHLTFALSFSICSHRRRHHRHHPHVRKSTTTTIFMIIRITFEKEIFFIELQKKIVQ